MVSINSKRSKTKKDQPFYHLLAENQEVTYEAYVSEQNLIVDHQKNPLRHPLINEIFLRKGDLSITKGQIKNFNAINLTKFTQISVSKACLF